MRQERPTDTPHGDPRTAPQDAPRTDPPGPARRGVLRTAAAAGAGAVFWSAFEGRSVALPQSVPQDSRQSKAVRAADIVVNSFDTPGWGDWRTTGSAFGAGPAIGAELLRRLEITSYRGNGVATSERDGDGPTGTVTSPDFRIQRDYLAFGVGGGDYERVTCLNLLVDGKIVRSATGRNSDNITEASWDVRPWKGRTARVQIVDTATGGWGHVNVDHIVQTDRPARLPVTTQPLYQETWRPQVHFTARQWVMDRLNPGQRQEGWLNDLNGLIYFEGEYHLFAQRWNKCWIHAVSTDLVHWTELEPAFWEESLGSGVQSGSCVIDYKNTSGLGRPGGTPPMVAFWSRNDNRSHGLSYSLDRGRTWTHYAGNPVLVAPERDPKVFWYAPTGRWVMFLYGDGKYHVYTSPDLLRWTDERQASDGFECPDFFELPVDGDARRSKWVLVRGDGTYTLGTFDGTRFTEETALFTADSGPNFYATQSWANTETGDGRRIQAAWMRDGGYPEMPFNQQVTFPAELTLRTTPNGVRLHRTPVAELARLHARGVRFTGVLRDGQTATLSQENEAFHIALRISVPAGASLTLDVRGVPVVLGHRSVDNGSGPRELSAPLKTLDIIVDRTSVEVFANAGEVSVSRCYLPAHPDLTVTARGGTVDLPDLTLWTLLGVWPVDGRVPRSNGRPSVRRQRLEPS
ncbi:GH32 C-terminal domain-containing protein [Streptomyces sp. NPDC091281]|uniref:GH32 C-terminal domain-containing protein n=1 Tax=Streptomyces sp. NPDC091281 TaxID=3365985 RepID=UPI0038240634